MTKARNKANQSSNRLESLRKSLTSEQSELLNKIWDHFTQTKTWPYARVIHSEQSKKAIRKCLHGLGGHVVVEMENHQTGNQYGLTGIGILLTAKGEKFWGILCRYFEFLREMYKKQPLKFSFSNEETQKALNLPHEEILILGKLLDTGALSKGGSYGENFWNFRAPDEIEDFPHEGPIEKETEALLFKNFEHKRSVFANEVRHELSRSIYYSPFASASEPEKKISTNHVDVLKRRYQVFISSTYEDLKEERQHVIQALLETKCIPIGMELFPAASIEQWELIQRVINECDYYVVIVAGRYGSTHSSGIGYTEMEFDYALSIGKPVLGFCHKSPDSLPGTKLEKTDKGRKKLAAFSTKVKDKLCRFWSSPAELGSAVKSAIVNELEFNAKPGWIRADDMPSSEVVDKLKQRIADLEEKLKNAKESRSSFPSGKEPFTFTIFSKFDHHEVKGRLGPRQVPRKSAEVEIKSSWDEILLVLTDSLEMSVNLETICNVLESKFSNTTEQKLQSLGKTDDDYSESRISRSQVKSYLSTLIARKLVKEVVGHYGSWSDPRYQFTTKGLQYRAELRAVKALA